MARKMEKALQAKIDASTITTAQVNTATKATAEQTATVEVIYGEIPPYKPSSAAAQALTVYVRARAKKADAEAAMKAAAEVIKADIEAYEAATRQIVEEFTSRSKHVIYREVKSTRIDSASLKKELPEIYAEFSNTITTRPLKIS